MIDRSTGLACTAVAGCTALSATAELFHPLMAYAGLAGVALGAATALDDEAGPVTAATPRTARWRLLSRAPRGCAPLVVWLVAALLIDLRDPAWSFTFSVTIALSVGIGAFGAAALARKHGVTNPGEPVGTAVGGTVMVLLLAAPSIRGVSPFQAEPAALWWWLPMLGAGIWALVAGIRDPMLTPGTAPRLARPGRSRHPR